MVDFFGAAVLFAVDFPVVDFFAVDFFVVGFFVVDFFAVDFLAVDFFVVVFFATAFFLVAFFLAVGVDFFSPSLGIFRLLLPRTVVDFRNVNTTFTGSLLRR